MDAAAAAATETNGDRTLSEEPPYRPLSTTVPARNRVKVYALNGDSWDETGVGDLEYNVHDGEVNFVVRCETSADIVLLKASTSTCDKYSRQQDTLIVWTDQTDNDYSFSFQERLSCDETWALICQAKGCDVSREEIGQDDDLDGCDDLKFVSDNNSEARLDIDMITHAQAPELPPPEIGNLEKWQEILDGLADQKHEAMAKGDRDMREMVTNQYEQIAAQLVDDEKNFLTKLLNTFEMCEDLEDTESLHRCYAIMVGMFTMCNNSLFEALFEHDILIRAIGMLEFDPNYPRKHHREFLTEHVKFKEVINLGDDTLINLIHQSYRIQYIKDVIFAGVLDDFLQNTLQSYVYYCNVEVCQRLSNDSNFINELFTSLADTSTPADLLRDRVMLLKEFCILGKSLQGQNKPKLYSTLAQKGLFELFHIWLEHPSIEIKRAALGILAIFQQQDPQLIRQSILNPRGVRARPSVLKALVTAFVNETSTVLLPQLMAAIRYIIDVVNFEAANASEKTKLLSIFYEEHMDQLMSPLEWDTTGNLGIVEHEKVNQALCVLSFTIPMHTYHAKNYTMRKGTLQAAMKHAESDKSVLVLSALRLLRVVVGFKNEFYYRHLIKHGLFTPVVDVLIRNGPKYNLLNSCILEMLKFIESENIKTLVSHFAEVHGEKLKNLTYVDTAQDLLNKHLKNTEVVEEENTADSLALAEAENRKRRDTTMDMEEENYWDDEKDEKDQQIKKDEDSSTHVEEEQKDQNEDAKEDTPPPFVPFRKRLVNYDSDDDEDDAIFALAAKKQAT